MSHVRFVALVAAVAQASMFSACSAERPLTPSAIQAPHERILGVSESHRDLARGTDREFLELADSVPGFAGYYFENDGTVRALVADGRPTSNVTESALKNATYSDPNIVTVNDPGSTFSIAATYPYPHAGEIVEHVGRTTGWQSGTVVETCTDMPRTDLPTNRNFVLLCQTRVTATSGMGDSGGPAFFFNAAANTVTLVGMVWSGGGFEIGTNSEGNKITSEMWISPWENISIDYPGLSIQ